MEKILLRPMEAAQLIGIGRTKMYEMVASGELPSIHIGRARRIPVNALNKWIDERQVKQAQL